MNPPDSTPIVSLLFLLIVIPGVSVYSWWKLRSGLALPPKLQRYKGMIALQILVLFNAIVAGRGNRIPLFAHGNTSVWIWMAALTYLVFVAIRMMTTWSRLSEDRRKRARSQLPENQSEMLVWVPIAILAGLSEEYAYRGVAYSTLMTMTHSLPVTLAVCIGAFGLAHLPNGWHALAQSSLLALIFHLLVILTQTLLFVVLFHIAYDLVVGFSGLCVINRERRSSVANLTAV